MTTPTPVGDFTQMPVGPNPVQICPPLGQGVTVTIYNADIANIVTVSRNNSVALNAGNGAPIQPLTSAVLDASKALYAVAPAGTAQLVILPQGGTLSPSPAQIAAQISALGLAKETTQLAQSTTIPNGIANTGVPLLSKSNSLLNASAQTLAGAGVHTFGPLTIGQIGYEISISLTIANTAANPFTVFLMTWSDSTSGLIVSQEEWSLSDGTSPISQVFLGTGRTKGDTLNIQVTNTDPITTVTYSVSFVENSRVYDRDDWRQQSKVTVPNNTNASSDEPANTLFSTSGMGVTNGSSTARLLPLYAGTIEFWMIHNVAGNPAAGMSVSFTELTATGVELMNLVFPATNLGPIEITFPRKVILMTVSNAGTINDNVTCSARIKEFLQ